MIPRIEKESDNSVSLVGQCDIDAAVAIRKELELLIRRCSGAQFSIDFKGLESVSSSILSLMLCCLRVAQAERCELSFRNLPPKLYDMARVGGLESLLPLDNQH